MKKILVIGAGAWGLAIANTLSLNNNNVLVSSIENDIIEEINNLNSANKYLPNIKLSSNLKAISDYTAEIIDCDFIFIAVPSLAVKLVISQISEISKINPNCEYVICSKGLDPDSLQLLSYCFNQYFSNKNCAILSGPNFAIEVASKLPTITNICCTCKKSADNIIKILNNSFFLAIHDDQPVTAEICGVIKNILAIGCGIIDQMDLGVNAKAAIITYGSQEIQKLAKYFNCSANIVTAAGFGDIFLTCSSTKSRNNNLGRMLAQGKSYNDISSNSVITYEGAHSALSIYKISQQSNIKLPLCNAIYEIIYNNMTLEEIKSKIISTLIC
jgi:glycerol-3-phosphate dehydrogenase (NAD(P)+)